MTLLQYIARRAQKAGDHVKNGYIVPMLAVKCSDTGMPLQSLEYKVASQAWYSSSLRPRNGVICSFGRPDSSGSIQLQSYPRSRTDHPQQVLFLYNSQCVGESKMNALLVVGRGGLLTRGHSV